MTKIREPLLTPPERRQSRAGRCRRCGWSIQCGERCYRLTEGLLCEACAAELLRGCRIWAGEET